MRLSALMLLAAVSAAAPAFAQQVSPMTGTTSGVPSVTPAAPGAPAAPAASAHRTSRRQTLQQRFEAANTTHDGKLTAEQAKAGHMPRVAQNFDAIDTGKKSYVTLDDIHAYNRAQRAARKAANQPASPR